jgi:hypothetical protein
MGHRKIGTLLGRSQNRLVSSKLADTGQEQGYEIRVRGDVSSRREGVVGDGAVIHCYLVTRASRGVKIPGQVR